MKNELKNNINKICLQLTNRLEECSPNYPIGTCYLIGHCLAEGLKKAGYNSKEITGTAIFKDKNEKNIIYGKSIVKGSNIGTYHTWCVLEIEGETIVIDASYKYNKVAMKSCYNLKLNNKIPDFIITNNSNSWLHTYVEDMKLTQLSKDFLETVSPEMVNILVNTVEQSARNFLIKQKM